MTNRRLTARQLTKALAEIDAKLAQLDRILAEFEALAGLGLTDEMGDAYNATHDARQALECHRAEVELNPRPIPAGELGTWALVQMNID